MKDNKWLLLFETVKLERLDIQTQYQIVYDNRALTHKLCSKQLVSNQKTKLQLWQQSAQNSQNLVNTSFPIFCLCFQLRTNQRKPNHHPQTNHISCTACSWPTSSFSMPITSIQNIPEAFPFFTIKLCHSPACL